ncbi:MAG: type II toxin-antitoxin system HicA family toxin [Chloroflexota bacterium]|nr:type II toxin-antitoxin system HicA family toxin [Chloroflexota bacterium]
MTDRLPSVNYRRLTRRLRKLGCEFLKQAKGSHEVWWHPEKQLFTTIPNHGHRDIVTGTVRKILKDLDISPEDFGPPD